MKNKLLLFSLLLAGSAFLFSCKKDTTTTDPSIETTKQISAFVSINSDGIDSLVFTYDAAGVLTKMDEYTNHSSASLTHNFLTEFGYSGGKYVTRTKYSLSNNQKINYEKDSIGYDSNNLAVKLFGYNLDINNNFVLNTNYTTVITYNSSNLPVKFDHGNGNYDTYENYTNGDVNTVKGYENNALIETDTYQYDNKNNPFKGNVAYFGNLAFYVTNDVVKETYGTDAINYTYTYNSANYPIKMVQVWGTTSADTETDLIYYK